MTDLRQEGLVQEGLCDHGRAVDTACCAGRGACHVANHLRGRCAIRQVWPEADARYKSVETYACVPEK